LKDTDIRLKGLHHRHGHSNFGRQYCLENISNLHGHGTSTILVVILFRSFANLIMQNLVFIPIVYFLFPETANKSLEDIDFVFLKRDRLSADQQQWVDMHGLSTVETEMGQADKDLESKNTVQYIEKTSP